MAVRRYHTAPQNSRAVKRFARNRQRRLICRRTLVLFRTSAKRLSRSFETDVDSPESGPSFSYEANVRFRPKAAISAVSWRARSTTHRVSVEILWSSRLAPTGFCRNFPPELRQRPSLEELRPSDRPRSGETRKTPSGPRGLQKPLGTAAD
jgi:hypothetical protein